MKMLIDFLRKRKVNETAVRYIEYAIDLSYWILLVYVAMSGFQYFYGFCGIKIAEVEQNCVIICQGNYTPSEYNWTNLIQGNATNYING